MHGICHLAVAVLYSMVHVLRQCTLSAPATVEVVDVTQAGKVFPLLLRKRRRGGGAHPGGLAGAGAGAAAGGLAPAAACRLPGRAGHAPRRGRALAAGARPAACSTAAFPFVHVLFGFTSAVRKQQCAALSVVLGGGGSMLLSVQ